MPDPQVTPTPLTPTDLAQIAARVEAAVPPPWALGKSGVTDCPMCDGEGEVDLQNIDCDGWDAMVQVCGFEKEAGPVRDFVLNARTDIPRLLAHVAAQAARIEALKRAACRFVQAADVMAADSDATFEAAERFGKARHALAKAMGFPAALDATDDEEAQ